MSFAKYKLRNGHITLYIFTYIFAMQASNYLACRFYERHNFMLNLYDNQTTDMLEFLTIQDSQDLPQTVLANKTTKRAVAWFPGRLSKELIYHDSSKYLVGFTGKYFASKTLNIAEQAARLHWIGIDIDLHDYTDELFLRTYDKILHATGGLGNIRASTRGHGFHIIFRLARVMLEVSRANIIATIKPYTDALLNSGVEICTFGVNMYLLGGLQRWLYTTQARIEPVSNTVLSFPTSLSCSRSSSYHQLYTNELHVKGKECKELLALLAGVGIQLKQGRNDMYVRDVFEALKGTKFAFKTKSTMRASEGRHINGCINVGNLFISIFTFADNKIVARYNKLI